MNKIISNENATLIKNENIMKKEQILIDNLNTYIQIGIGSLLFFFGLTFNILSFFYFRISRSFHHTSFQLYFSIISILDTIRLFEFLVFLLFDKGYLQVTLTLCRLVFFTIMFTGQASIWLTVALAVEKSIIIWFPIKGRLCFTMSISKLILISVLLFVFLTDFIYLLPGFFLKTYENRSIHTFMCVWQTDFQSLTNKYDQWKKQYFTLNTIFFHSIIPSFLLLILNWLILYSLSRQRDDLTKIGSIDAKNILKREKQFKEKIIQLVLSSFFVIITISPRYILTMVNAFSTNHSNKQPIMPWYIYVSLNTIFRVIEMSNYSLNMIFAILSGQTSRLEIRKYLSQCCFNKLKKRKKKQDHHQRFDYQLKNVLVQNKKPMNYHDNDKDNENENENENDNENQNKKKSFLNLIRSDENKKKVFEIDEINEINSEPFCQLKINSNNFYLKQKEIYENQSNKKSAEKTLNEWNCFHYLLMNHSKRKNHQETIFFRSNEIKKKRNYFQIFQSSKTKSLSSIQLNNSIRFKSKSNSPILSLQSLSKKNSFHSNLSNQIQFNQDIHQSIQNQQFKQILLPAFIIETC